ncbi:MAG: hypothetical protein Q8Q59_09435 [Luteolibacter sp.]|jgi:hypothetical protein|nr:hypothetical protein [Luteolibacter sp.]
MPFFTWVCCCATAPLFVLVNLHAAPVLVDLGSASPSSGPVNNLTDSAMNSSIAGLKDNAGATTGISLRITDAFHSITNLNNGRSTLAGAAATAGFTAAMSQDYFLLNNEPFGGESTHEAAVRFSGLVAGQSYRLSVYSSRDDLVGPRLLGVTLQGATTEAGMIEGTNNNSNVLELTSVATSGATLDCYFEAITGSKYAHINALRLTPLPAENSVPVASDVAWVGAPRVGGTVTGSYLFGDADGDAETGTTTHWERANDAAGSGAQAISRATATSYLSQEADAGKYLRYVVTPGAATGATPGFPASSAWRGPMAAAAAIGTFHVGNSFTRWGNVPQQLVNHAAAAGGAHAALAQLTDGQNLAYQWANRFAYSPVQHGVPSAPELVTGTWDALVLQAQSREWLPASLAAFTANAQNFQNLASAHGTPVYLYAFWPYLSEPATLQTNIDAAFEQVRAAISSGNAPAHIIPVGAAFKAVSDAITAGSITGITRASLYQDEIHPSTLGFYLSSLVHYATLRRQSPVGLPAQGINAAEAFDNLIAIDPTLAAKFQIIAWDTARHLGTSGITAGRFATWADDLPDGQQGMADIPFADGVPNLTRYAFGLSTTGQDAGSGRLPACVTTEEGHIALEYRLGADAEDAGVLTFPEWSEDLVTWTHPAPAGLMTTRNGEHVRLDFPAGETQVFLRVRVAMP